MNDTGRIRLRLADRRLRLRRKRLGAAPRGEGLQGRGPRGGSSLPRRGLREDDLGPEALPVGAGDRPARNFPAHTVQGRVHRERRGGRRRKRRLCQHAVPCQSGVLRQSTVGRHQRLVRGARAALRHRREDARCADGAPRERRPGPAARGRQAFRRGRYVSPHPGWSLLRQARHDRAGPVLRRRRARAHRLHPLRRLHGRLPRRREEHAGQELPVVRGKARRRDPSRARSRGYPADRCRGWRRRLHGDDRATGRLVPQAAAHVSRPAAS